MYRTVHSKIPYGTVPVLYFAKNLYNSHVINKISTYVKYRGFVRTLNRANTVTSSEDLDVRFASDKHHHSTPYLTVYLCTVYAWFTQKA